MTPARSQAGTGPITSLFAALIMVVLLVTLFVVLLPVALVLVGLVVLLILWVKIKAAFEARRAEGGKPKRVPRHDREGRRNVRVVKR